MNDADKNLELIIAALWVYDKDVKLPYALKIGEEAALQTMNTKPAPVRTQAIPAADWMRPQERSRPGCTGFPAAKTH